MLRFFIPAIPPLVFILPFGGGFNTLGGPPVVTGVGGGFNTLGGPPVVIGVVGGFNTIGGPPVVTGAGLDLG